MWGLVEEVWVLLLQFAKKVWGWRGVEWEKHFGFWIFPPASPLPPPDWLWDGEGRGGGGVVGCVVGGPYLSCVLLQYKTGIPPYTLPLQLSGSVALKQGSIYYCPATSRRFLLHLATYKCKQRRALSEEATEHCQ